MNEVELVRCAHCGERYEAADACPACGTARVEFACDRHEGARAEGRCVICGVAVCRACSRGKGRAHLCGVHSSVPVIQGWAQVYSTTSEFEAQLVRENLVAEGIDAQIFSQRDQMFSVDLGELSIVRLLVPAWAYPQADEIIRSHMNAEGEVAFACPSCGEAYDAGVTNCATCGAGLTSGRTD